MNKEKENREEIQIRSDEVQEILSHVPNWMIRWGITLIFFLIMLFLFLSWLIKYPDIVKGTATLTTQNPPIKLVAKVGGELEDIHFPKKTKVKQGDVIATVNSTLSPQAKIFLENMVDSIKVAQQNKQLAELKLPSTPFVFGEIQTNYVALTTAIQNFQYLINKGNLSFTIANINEQIHNQKALKHLTQLQIQNQIKAVENAKHKFTSDKLLYKKDVISRSEFYKREASYQATIASLNNLKKSKINISITISTLEKQLNDTQHKFDQQKTDLLQKIDNQIETIENSILTWQRTYALTAPINGKLTYLLPLNENENVNQGEALFAIIPNNESYIAQLKIAKNGYGKVKVGQKVILRLDNYPYSEYGEVIGKVKSISLIPNEKGYLVQATLVRGLKTTYGKKLDYSPEMSGSAQIITEDLRTSDRIFNQFRKILSR